jgi:hypothetical protein
MINLSVVDPAACWVLATVMAFAVHSSAAHFGDFLRVRAEEKLRPPAGSIVPRPRARGLR